jgi:hypothetical protein
MKQLFLIITLFAMLAILTVNISAQTSDDSDNDGVKNSEDLCPNEKGTIANKGCPGKDEPKPTAEKPKKQDSTAKVELIDLATMSRPQNNNQVGSFADCKYILSDGCRNYFYQSGIDLVAKQLNLSRSYDEFMSLDKYTNSNRSIRLIVEPSTGRILETTIERKIIEIDKTIKPHKDLKWDVDFVKAQKKLGETRSFWRDSDNSSAQHKVFVYSNYELGFVSGDLDIVWFKQNPTENELVARKKRAFLDNELRIARKRQEDFERTEAKRKEAEAEANKTPEQRAREKEQRIRDRESFILSEFKSFHEYTLKNRMNQINEKVEYLKQNSHRIFPHMVESRIKEIDKLRSDTREEILGFMTKYRGELHPAMLEQLNTYLTQIRGTR